MRLWKLDAKLRSFELIGTVAVPGVVNSLQFVTPPKDWWEGVSWAQRRTPGAARGAVALLLVAGLGQETRLGRWITVKEGGARNGTAVLALHPRT